MINIPKKYSQINPLYAYKNIKSWYVKDIGCTSTDLTMLLEVFGYDLNPNQFVDRMASNGYDKNGLIYWQQITNKFPKCKFVKRSKTYNNLEVLKSINSGIPVLVEVLLRGRFKHWVLAIGDHKVIDPLKLFNQVQPFSNYNVIGYAIFKK